MRLNQEMVMHDLLNVAASAQRPGSWASPASNFEQASFELLKHSSFAAHTATKNQPQREQASRGIRLTNQKEQT
jgi:hypothetical protein